MNMETFVSYSGRIGRQTWWIAGIIVGILQGIVSVLVSGVLNGMETINSLGSANIPILVIAVCVFVVWFALIWAAFAIYAKRWHDRGKSGWWSLIAVIPLVGALWMLVELGFLKGDEGPNRFGPAVV